MTSIFSEQVTLFFQSVVLGMIFGVNYDFFRAIRREFRLRFVGILLCDIFFWIVNILMFLLFILNFANSEGRMYIIFAIILGATLYFLSLYVIVLSAFCYIFRIFRKIISICFLDKNRKNKKI